ncbi:MAG: phage holin family protein [Eubacterium sp.]|nr:phage holin family protein [Eubacterium sp.]
MNDIILLAVQLGIAVAAFVAGKYVFLKVPKTVTDKLNVLSQWAAQFVVWAKEFMKKQTGEEKMAAVVEKLKEIADEAGLGVTQDQLKAIAQSAYNAMKAGEKGVGTDNAAYYKMGQRQKGSTVNIYTGYSGTTAVATNNVPDGALEDNSDGSVNVYNEAGEKVGTISAEEAEAAEQNVRKIVIAEDGGEWLPQRTG